MAIGALWRRKSHGFKRQDHNLVASSKLVVVPIDLISLSHGYLPLGWSRAYLAGSHNMPYIRMASCVPPALCMAMGIGYYCICGTSNMILHVTDVLCLIIVIHYVLISQQASFQGWKGLQNLYKNVYAWHCTYLFLQVCNIMYLLAGGGQATNSKWYAWFEMMDK